ncbi:MAG: polyisoprenoid-binding protein [Verrucomicrobia bacterium]|nr:MAG: polyisoprenoid-binding protein [Verrucomicrobiota bacterium]
MGAAIKGKTSVKPMIRFSWLSLILAGFIHSVTANETFKFDASRSTIGFRVHQFLGTTDGKFKQFSGTIDLDRQHPEASSVSARIQVSSINTGIKKRDDHLRSAEFFNVANFPEITFKSRGVKQTGTQSGDITGDLTMHGITKPVTLHVKVINPLANEARTRWEVTTEPLKRRDFGLMFGSATETVSGISQEVAIRIEIEAVKSR